MQCSDMEYHPVLDTSEWCSFDIFIRCSILAKSNCMWNQVVSWVWFLCAKEEEEEEEEANSTASTQESKNIALPTYPYLVKNKESGTFFDCRMYDILWIYCASSECPSGEGELLIILLNWEEEHIGCIKKIRSSSPAYLV